MRCNGGLYIALYDKKKKSITYIKCINSKEGFKDDL